MKIVALALCALSLAAVSPAFAQAETDNPTMAMVLSGQVYPLVLKMKDLDSRWSVISRPPSSDKDDLYVLVHAGRLSSYTKGDVFVCNGESFLVTYQPELPTKSSGTAGGGDFVLRLSSDSLLDLTLVNLRTLAKLTGIKTFNLTAETGDLPDTVPVKPAVLPSPPPPSVQKPKPPKVEQAPFKLVTDPFNNAASDANLKAIGYALTQYSQKHRATLPPLLPINNLHEALAHDVASEATFQDPNVNLPYTVNVTASGKKLSRFPVPGMIPVLWEPLAHADRTRGVVFADGHSRRVKETDWQAIARLHVNPASAPAPAP
jgi:hypothetical protein